MIWLVVVGTISQSELCWVVLTNQLHTHVVGKISCGDTVMRCHSGRGQVKWPTGLVAGGKSNDWLFWWQGARQMTDWFGGRGQGKWLTNVVTWWCGAAVVEDKANDWLMWWHGACQMTDCFGGSGHGTWLTGLVAGGMANAWLMWWDGDAVTLWCSDALTWWHGGTVVEGKANEWLVWWQGARQMTD